MIPLGASPERAISLPEPNLSSENTALLVIDMQYSSAHPDFGVCARLRAQGEQRVVSYYTARLAVVTRNTQYLLAAFRERRMEVIYARVQSLTQDGRDRSREHKQLNIHRPPGSKEGEIIDEVKPTAGEIVLSKTCGSVFNGTMIDYVLRNLRIRNLVLVGVVTSGCVENTARDASNRGYSVMVVEDACATWTPDAHATAIAAMDETSAKIKSTTQVLDLLTALEKRKPAREENLVAQGAV